MALDSTFNWILICVVMFSVLVRIILEQTSRLQKKRVFQFWQRVGLPMATEQIHDSFAAGYIEAPWLPWWAELQEA